MRTWRYIGLLLGVWLPLLLGPQFAHGQLSLLRSGSSSGTGLIATLQSDDFAISTTTFRNPVLTDKRFSMQFAAGHRQWLSFTTGYIRLTSIPDNMTKVSKLKAPWRYKAIPLTVGYSYTLRDEDKRLVPIISASVSYYLSNMKEGDVVAPVAPQDVPSTSREAHTVARELRASPELDRNVDMAQSFALSFDERLGMGYGAEIGISLRANIDRHVFVQFQQRICYVNGLAFTPSSSFDAEFTKVDFSIGLGFRF